ncbi:hypothetical protein LINPERPRIM_LOCUS32097, partial [Linum perenne]
MRIGRRLSRLPRNLCNMTEDEQLVKTLAAESCYLVFHYQSCHHAEKIEIKR